jgi:hypothetical protein
MGHEAGGPEAGDEGDEDVWPIVIVIIAEKHKRNADAQRQNLNQESIPNRVFLYHAPIAVEQHSPEFRNLGLRDDQCQELAYRLIESYRFTGQTTTVYNSKGMPDSDTASQVGHSST